MTWQDWRDHIAETHTTAKEQALFLDWTADRVQLLMTMITLYDRLGEPLPEQYRQTPDIAPQEHAS